MGRITIYLPDKIEAELQEAAASEHTSVSHWIAGLISEKLRSKWPAAVPRTFGAFPDFPEARELRHGYGKDSARDPIGLTTTAAARPVPED
jgi:hypothetical protein